MKWASLVCVAMATAAFAAAADPEPRLAYAVQRLGNADGVAVVSPGAAGTSFAFALTYTLGSWSRFNWPLFEPVPGLQEVRFWLRADGPEAGTAVCRLLSDDGIEWQSAPLPVGVVWREITLGTADFAWFRGGTKEDAGMLDLARVQQFQIVPATRSGEGKGTLQIDEVRLLPTGPAWNAEAAEQRPRRDAVELEHERLCDALGRWLAEVTRLGLESERTEGWSADLEALVADWQDRGQRQAVLARLRRRACAWQQPPPRCADPLPSVPLTLADYRQQRANLDAAPVPLLDFNEALSLSASRLYSAPEQTSPTIVGNADQAALRQRIRFSPERARQTVFTNVALPKPRNLDDQRLLLRWRCTATNLNPEPPLLLRLFTDAGGGESWADFTPSALPGPEWQEASFDLANPVRQARGNPAATLSLALRFENTPGAAAEFDVEVADLRLAPPEPSAAVRRRLLRSMAARVATARDRLAALRDRVAELEDGLRDLPALRTLYLASFEAPAAESRTAPMAAPTPASDALAGMPLPQRPVNPGRFLTDCVLGGQSPELHVRSTGLPADAELGASASTPDGTVVATGRAQAASLALPLPGARPWAPGQPFRYRLRLAAMAQGRLLAYDERDVGLRTSAVVPAGPTPLLRHVSHRRQPDWTLLLNGQCWFPRMTVYHWPEPEKTELAGVRLLGDLWVDGLRSYGFGANPTTWERFDRRGLALLSSLAPNYRNLESWDDMAPWEEDYARACRMAAPLRNRPAQIVAQVGNEVELAAWGATIGSAFPDALYQPLDQAAAILRREWDPDVPIMYVRAGTFRDVPPLPHEQICGVNQYTGRYGGRLDEIGRDLAEIARYSLWADRPLMITEWMGPKYSWASSGIGGVSPRGAAYYLERYWRAMIGTPGIVGSSEFTLNWVIAPFEDLTNQTREEAWRKRPRHDPFGGGHTADHVPVVAPGDADRADPCVRSMQAFQSPLYVMANSPGGIVIAGTGAEGLVAALTSAGVTARMALVDADTDLARAQSHLVLLRPVHQATAFPPDADEPVFRTVLNPASPDFLVATLDAPTPEARERGVNRLTEAAMALCELRESEGAMTRALVLTDTAHVQTYSSYLLEFAGRGYLFSGDDVRTELNEREFLDGDGRLRPAWESLSAVILDCARPLSEQEADLVEKLGRGGANVLMAAGCHEANPRLRALFPATLARCGTLAEHVALADTAMAPLPVHDLAGVDVDRIRRFRADLAESPGLSLFAIETEGAAAIALTAAGKPVIAHKPFDKGNLFLLGLHLGAAVEVHRRVTHAGVTHPLYDRDTACGLERVSRVVVNLCRYGCPERRLRPQLVLRLTPARTLVPTGESLLATVSLTDDRGIPVAGDVRARVRVVQGGRPAATGPYVDLAVAETALLEVRNASPPAAGTAAPPVPAGLTYSVPAAARSPVVVSVQIKAYAPGFVPADGAIAFVLTSPEQSAP